MSRIIFVPQYPTPMRYQEWWWWKFPEEFSDAGFDVKILGSQKVEEIKCTRGALSVFSPLHASVDLECAQIDEYMNLDLRDDDILFLSDLSFPGLFSNILHHKKPSRCFAFCHATSLNNYDYFESVRYSKYPVECGQSKLFTHIFVGSNYHRNKLMLNGFPGNIHVSYLPYPPKSVISPLERERDKFIISVSRPTPQKVDTLLERHVDENYGEIHKSTFRTWKEYCEALSSSKCMLVTSQEETFGYQVVDAIINGCIPVVPNRYSYVELVERQYRYDSLVEMFDILDKIKSDELTVPKLFCELRTKNFFRNIIEIMRRGGV
jgi:hypothetical protein